MVTGKTGKDFTMQMIVFFLIKALYLGNQAPKQEAAWKNCRKDA
jgi:hypothetical protein